MTNPSADLPPVTLTPDSTLEGCALTLSKAVADTLNKHYPGWAWGVRVDVEQGVLEVRSMRIPGRYGFLLKLKSIDPEGKAIMRAGGELLERYRQKRAAYNLDRAQDIRKDTFGMAVPDQ